MEEYEALAASLGFRVTMGTEASKVQNFHGQYNPIHTKVEGVR